MGRPDIHSDSSCARGKTKVLSGANQTHGYASLVVAREFTKRLVWAQRDRHEHEHGQHGHEVLERVKAVANGWLVHSVYQKWLDIFSIAEKSVFFECRRPRDSLKLLICCGAILSTLQHILQQTSTSTAQHNTTQHSTSTAQHSTTQHTTPHHTATVDFCPSAI